MRLITGLLIFILASFFPLQAQEGLPFPIRLELGKKEGADVLLGLKLDIQAPWRVYAPAPEGEVGFGFPPELVIKSQNIKLIIYNPDQEVIQQWIK